MFRLRANLDETRLTLEARNNSLEKLQQSVLEKEQVCKRNVFCLFLFDDLKKWKCMA
jgi:hypothetical protein